MVGLVAANSVVVYHPVSRGSRTDVSTRSRSPRSQRILPEFPILWRPERRQERSDHQPCVDDGKRPSTVPYEHPAFRPDERSAEFLDLRVHPDSRAVSGSRTTTRVRISGPCRCGARSPKSGAVRSVSPAGGTNGFARTIPTIHACSSAPAVFPAVDECGVGIEGDR